MMKFYTPVHVRFSDLDALGHVNNATYFHYVEDARIHYFEEVVRSDNDWKRFGVLLAHNEIDYKLPVVLSHRLMCGIKVTSMGKKSIHADFEFVIDDEHEKIVAAAGFMCWCVTITNDNQPLKFPPNGADERKSTKDFVNREYALIA